jgi:hypothetical protein
MLTDFNITMLRRLAAMPQIAHNVIHLTLRTLIKKKIKFSSYIRKFRVEQLQSHIWLTASSYIGKYLPISSYFANAPLWISLIQYEENVIFFFISAYAVYRSSDSMRGLVLQAHTVLAHLTLWVSVSICEQWSGRVKIGFKEISRTIVFIRDHFLKLTESFMFTVPLNSEYRVKNGQISGPIVKPRSSTQVDNTGKIGSNVPTTRKCDQGRYDMNGDFNAGR